MIFGKRFDNIELQIKELRQIIDKKPDKLDKDAYERLADLEIKMSKLWGMLTETTVTGKERLSKFGRRFGGKSKAFISNNQ